MAFFKFRKNSPSPQDAPSARSEAAAAAETVESLRRRALYRLIGAAVLVLIAIVGFPLLFDTQPRPVSVQAPIIIPDRNAVPPLVQHTPASAGRSVSGPLPAPSAVPAAASLATGEELRAPAAGDKAATSPTASGAVVSVPQAAREDARAKQQPAAKQTAQKQTAQKQTAEKQAAEKRKADEQAKRQRDQSQSNQTTDAARALALLQGKHAPPPAAGASASAPAARAQEGRYVIQIGAFTSAQSAQSARQKAERAGVKAYTQAVTTSAGPRTRVRAGPFASRDEAAQMLAKLKQAGLAGSIMAP